MEKTSRVEVWLTEKEIEQLRILAAKEGHRSSGKYLQHLTRLLLAEQTGVPAKKEDAKTGVPAAQQKEVKQVRTTTLKRYQCPVCSSVLDLTGSCPDGCIFPSSQAILIEESA